jgi:hypothetical protein
VSTKPALAVVLLALAWPAAAGAQASLVARDVPLTGARTRAASTPEFDLVGVHWQGPGAVRFRTRAVGGGWSAWHPAAPEAEDLPDGPRGRWRLGNPFWTGASDAIQYRLVGTVRRLRAYFVRSPTVAVPARSLSIAGSPPLVARPAWGADESIRRKDPDYAPSVRFAIVHHTAGTNGYSRAQSAAIVRGIERYHVLGNGWDDIGYNFLVDKYGQVFEGRWGGVDRNVIGAHAQGFNSGSTGIAVIGDYGSSGISAAARTAVASLIAWRLDVAHVDPLSTLTYASGGNPRFPAGTPVFLRAVSGHRDTGFTSCPGNALYAQLGSLAGAAAATGLPKLYVPAAKGQVGQPVRVTALLTATLPWTVTITDASGATVASGSGTGNDVDWTWDATAAPIGRYTYTIAAPDVRPAVGPVGPRLPKLRILSAGVSPAALQAGSALVRYRLTAPATVTATLTDASGVAVGTVFTAPKKTGAQSFRLVSDGLPDGRYRLALTAQAIDGQRVSATVPLSVDRTLASLAPGATTVDRGAALAFSFLVNVRPVHATLRIQRGASTVVTVATADYQPGAQTVTWNGRTATGKALPAGRYSAVLRGTSSIATVTLTAPFRVH